MTTPDPIDTLLPNDILLREFEPSDIPHVTLQLNDSRIASWLAAVPSPFQPSDADLLIETIQSPENCARVIAHKDDRRTVLGCLCLGTNTWFWLVPEAWGKGLMQSALEHAIPAYFAMNAAPIFATARADNIGSKRVLERLGFSAMPGPRRMFFQSEKRSHRCIDYVLAPEQWVLLRPPKVDLGGATITPASRQNVSALAQLLPRSTPWPQTEADRGFFAFIEKHRYRGGATGLFVIKDENRSVQGAMLAQHNTEPELFFAHPSDAEKFANPARDALARLTLHR